MIIAYNAKIGMQIESIEDSHLFMLQRTDISINETNENQSTILLIEVEENSILRGLQICNHQYATIYQ